MGLNYWFSKFLKNYYFLFKSLIEAIKIKNDNLNLPQKV